MKRLLLFALLLTASAFGQIQAGIVGASSAAAALSISVGTSVHTDNVAGTACTMSITPTAGVSWLVSALYETAAAPVVSIKNDIAGDDAKWVTDWNVNYWSTHNGIVAHIFNASASASSITVTVTTAGTGFACIAVPITFTGGTPTLDASGKEDLANGVFTTSPWSANAAITPTAGKNAVIFGLDYNEGGGAETLGATAPWAATGTQSDGGSSTFNLPVYRIIASTSGTYNPTGTSTGGFDFVGVITFYH